MATEIGVSSIQKILTFLVQNLASLVAQMVKNLPAMQETWVWSLSQKRSPGEENGIHFSGFLPGESHGQRSLAGARLFHPWDFPGKNTGMGCHFLLQGIFPVQGSKLGLPHCRQTLPFELPANPYWILLHQNPLLTYLQFYWSIIKNYNCLYLIYIWWFDIHGNIITTPS